MAKKIFEAVGMWVSWCLIEHYPLNHVKASHKLAFFFCIHWVMILLQVPN
jgi:hypothetical protein